MFFAVSAVAGCGAFAAAAHPVIERYKTECLPKIEGETMMPEAGKPFSDTHQLRWRSMQSGASSCVVSIRDDHVLPDDRRAEEQAGRRAVAEEMRVAAPKLVDAMIARGYELCADTSTEVEHNTLLRKRLDDGRSISALVWMLPEFPIAVMTAGILTKAETDEQTCEMEIF